MTNIGILFHISLTQKLVRCFQSIHTVHCGLPTMMVTALFDSVFALGYSNHVGCTLLLISFAYKMKLWHANLSFSSCRKDETCFHFKIPYNQFIISMCDKYFYSRLFPANRNEQCNQHSNVISARRDFLCTVLQLAHKLISGTS